MYEVKVERCMHLLDHDFTLGDVPSEIKHQLIQCDNES